MNKKNIIILILLIVPIILLTGCDKLVHNPRTIKVKTDKGNATLVYDDSRQFQLNSLANNYFLQNSALNFTMFISNYTGKQEDHEKQKKEFAEDKDSKYLEKVKINKYTGYGRVNKKTAATELYIYLDKKNNIVLCIKINATDGKKLKKQKNIEDTFLKKKEIKEILDTLKYKNK